MTVRPGIAVLVALGAAACINTGADRVLQVDADGVIAAQVLFDVNGSGTADSPDRVLGGVAIRLLSSTSNVQVARVFSDANGVARFRNVPVGRYRVTVDSNTVDDSLVVHRVDTTDVTLRPNDTVDVFVTIGFPRVTVAEARALPVGTKVFVEGIALTSRNVFGDSTLHLVDTTGAIRGVRVRTTNVTPGDSVRLLGTTALRDGQPVLDGVTTFELDEPGMPDPEVVSSAVAASADAGRLDANQVRVLMVTISDTATSLGDFLLTVSDGSGDLIVTIDAFAPIDFSPLLPDSVIDVSGVLVRSGASWTLKPRFDADILLRSP